jgi:hypothetical protein
MGPGRPKNQSSQNRTKPVPLCLSRRVDSGHIIFPQTDTVCESYRVLTEIPNRQKVNWVKVNADISRYDR